MICCCISRSKRSLFPRPFMFDMTRVLACKRHAAVAGNRKSSMRCLVTYTCGRGLTTLPRRVAAGCCYSPNFDSCCNRFHPKLFRLNLHYPLIPSERITSVTSKWQRRAPPAPARTRRRHKGRLARQRPRHQNRQ